MSSEYQSYREDRDRKVEMMSAELINQQEHSFAQTKQILAENDRLKQKLKGKTFFVVVFKAYLVLFLAFV